MENEKKVEISGTNNRYLIKKLKKEHKEVKTRKIAEKMGLPAESFLIDNQDDILKMLHQNVDSPEYRQALSQLEVKLNSYKHQDIIKKRYDETLFIKTKEVIDKLYDCELKCHYCNEKTYILYDLVRETKQWTLDRINNDIGHNTDNVLISCLDCNLKRRRTSKDAFLFTKQLTIVKS
ncbi:MAG: hypothetical protein EBY20_00635 [Alphaproteobacteria bacterium]|uniref:Uncharacterized protein n=1 Tax=viral metagenome TaxID=1070528 RepID=A0A6C0HRP6_9ZZZZ|nr:hypothetical protein [Alphaproteobacteria bacterium]